MSSTTGLPHPESLETDDQPVATSPAVAKRLVAALLSGLIPGTGQLLLGGIRPASLFLAVFAMSLALFWPLRVPHSYVGFCFSVLVLAFLPIVSAWHAARFCDAKTQRLSAWWLLLIVPLAYLGSNFDSNCAMRLGGFQVFYVPSSAMENTLIIGDRIVVDRRHYVHHRPEIGDIAVFRRNQIWEVKRVIALGGDTIYGQSNVIYRNGQSLREPYVIHNIGPNDTFPNTVNFVPLTVPTGKVFVMGDNRDVSYDSRQPEHGPISLTAESGKPLYIIWSPNHRRIGGILH